MLSVNFCQFSWLLDPNPYCCCRKDQDPGELLKTPSGTQKKINLYRHLYRSNATSEKRYWLLASNFSFSLKQLKVNLKNKRFS